MSGFKLQSTNWRDGMLLAMRHLRDEETYFEELIRWHAQSADDRYGLVRKDASQPPLKLSASMSGARLHVEVGRCQALLPCGMIVEIDESAGAAAMLAAEADVNKDRVPVFLGVGPGEKRAVGDPDPSEEVPRVPYEIPAYRLTIGEPPNLPESMYLQIALLAVDGAEVSPAKDFYAPCLSVNADERLSAVAVEFANRLENLFRLSVGAYRAATTDAALEGGSTKLQVAFRETTQYLAYHMASHLDDFVIGRGAPHPREFVAQFKRLFRVVSTLLNLQPGLKDYLNEKFFTKEANTDVGTWLSSIDSFLLSTYNHRDIAGQVRMIADILGTTRALMSFLSKTRDVAEQAVATETITYHGKTYRNCEFTGSKLEEVGELNYLVIKLGQPSPVKDTVALITKELFSDTQWRSMQVRLGVNEARGLGETDPVEVDTTAYSNKVVLHPMDMYQAASVKQVTLIFRGMPDAKKLAGLGKTDLIVYIA